MSFTLEFFSLSILNSIQSLLLVLGFWVCTLIITTFATADASSGPGTGVFGINISGIDFSILVSTAGISGVVSSIILFFGIYRRMSAFRLTVAFVDYSKYCGKRDGIYPMG